MNAAEFSKLLRTLRACEEAREWADGKSLEEVWAQCERGDWLLWLCGSMSGKDGWPTRQEVVLAACACAETALKFVAKGEERPRIAIETARRWAKGEATLQQVRTAADAAHAAAHAAAYAAAAAAYAAYAAAADAHEAAHAAAHAAADAAYAAAHAATTTTARRKALKKCADIVRSMLNVLVEVAP